jgi:hypothetical protein
MIENFAGDVVPWSRLGARQRFSAHSLAFSETSTSLGAGVHMLSTLAYAVGGFGGPQASTGSAAPAPAIDQLAAAVAAGWPAEGRSR